MDAVDEQAKDAQRSSGAGPGERLQAARVQKGLSLADVASRMHLSANIVEAIEDNHFEEITAPIFVKGYLRAYARIVSLDEDDMIDQYIDFYSGEDPPISSISNVASELSVADARVKWTTYIVVLIIGVSLAAWLWNQEQNTEAPISLDTQSSSIEDPAKSDTAVVSSEIEAVSEELIEADESVEATASQPTSVTATEVEPAASTATQQPSIAAVEIVAGEATASEATASEVAASEATASEATASEATASEATASEAAAGEAAAGEAAAGEAAASEAVEAETGALETAPMARNEPTRIAPGGSDKLKLVVHADTWADIKDATSYQLVYDLLRAEEAVELMGEAPFSVFLGNGHGVEIIFNGEEIDVAPRVRDDNTARLKIGG
jgi:cytoskeleton protein RodZ